MSWGSIAHAARQRWQQQPIRARRLAPGLVAGGLALVALLFLTHWSWGREVVVQAEAPAGATAGQTATLAATSAATSAATQTAAPTTRPAAVPISATSAAPVTSTQTAAGSSVVSPALSPTASTTPTLTTLPGTALQSPLPTPDMPAVISATLNTPISVGVPLPGGSLVPHLLPDPTLTPTLPVSATVLVTISTTSLTATAPITATDPVTAAIPPTATLTITEALTQPVADARGGIGEMVAAARARSANGDVPPAEAAPAAASAETPSPAAPLPETTVPEPAPTAAIAPTPDGTVRTARVPILMYHYLSTPPADANIYRLDLSVTPERFAAHLDAMQQAGYTTISLYTWLAHLTQGAPLPEKPVVITFDDGYRDNYENAFPLLRERGMTATFFIVTDFIDEQRPEYLTWDMVREMYAGGMSIESHGRNHISLENKDTDYLIWQALGSLETIQYELGVRPRFVSYPAGDYDQATIDIFRSANYWAGFTTVQGATHRSDDLFRAKRVRVHGSTTPEELLRILTLDW